MNVRISAGIGHRNDPYVVEKCSAEESALTQVQLLRGLGRGLGELWRIKVWVNKKLKINTDVLHKVALSKETEHGPYAQETSEA